MTGGRRIAPLDFNQTTIFSILFDSRPPWEEPAERERETPLRVPGKERDSHTGVGCNKM